MFKTKPGRLLQLASKSRLLIACRVATIVIQLLESVSASLRFQWENIPKRWSNSLPKCVLLFEKTEVKRVSCFAKTCHVFFFLLLISQVKCMFLYVFPGPRLQIKPSATITWSWTRMKIEKKHNQILAILNVANFVIVYK